MQFYVVIITSRYRVISVSVEFFKLKIAPHLGGWWGRKQEDER